MNNEILKVNDIIKKYGYYEEAKNKNKTIVYQVDNKLIDIVKNNNINYYITYCEYAPEIQKLWIYDKEVIKL